MTYDISQTIQQLGDGPKHRLSVEIYTTVDADNDKPPIYTFTRIFYTHEEAQAWSDILSDMFIVMKYEQ